ncbi:hypothetical protein GTPT_2254 [Tatumella ptyseos ATCC 33301]|uniref:Uncharacterized protein n=1 Tax=Tatumella ptyseos ATCC 33301 TaxID=1005995 RepID=A0A085JEQ7_9GAMM|nr:hypothetical protein GTPT_2254 [Tatumella ptyseos ATCC 33301]
MLPASGIKTAEYPTGMLSGNAGGNTDNRQAFRVRRQARVLITGLERGWIRLPVIRTAQGPV